MPDLDEHIEGVASLQRWGATAPPPPPHASYASAFVTVLIIMLLSFYFIIGASSDPELSRIVDKKLDER